MLSDIKYDDMKAVDLLKLGIRLVGEFEKLGIWKPTEDKRARCQVQAVWSKAHTSQREVLKPKHQKDKEVEEAVWKTTLDEVESGLLEDPLTKEEIEDKVDRLRLSNEKLIRSKALLSTQASRDARAREDMESRYNAREKTLNKLKDELKGLEGRSQNSKESAALRSKLASEHARALDLQNRISILESELNRVKGGVGKPRAPRPTRPPPKRPGRLAPGAGRPNPAGPGPRPKLARLAPAPFDIR